MGTEKRINSLPIDRGPSTWCGQRRMNDRLGSLYHRRVRREIGQIPDDRLNAEQRLTLCLLGVSKQGSHVMSAAKEGMEHRRTDVPGSTGQEDTHRARHCSRSSTNERNDGW
jgi:hypothetical protein